MKKVFMSAAIVALMAAAVSCECNNKKCEAPAEEPAVEAVEEENAVEAAAEDAAVEVIEAAADAAVEAIQK